MQQGVFYVYLFFVSLFAKTSYVYTMGRNALSEEYKTHVIPVKQPYFSFIEQGKKTWEGRLNRGRFLHIKQGEFIRFTQASRSCLCRIKSICPFESFRAMLSGEDEEGIPYYKLFIPKAYNIQEAEKVYLRFPGYREGQKKYGVVGLQLERQ